MIDESAPVPPVAPDGPSGQREAERSAPNSATYVRAVASSTRRKLRAQRRPATSVLSGLGLMGLVGWSVVLPTLIGAALGFVIDRRMPGGRSWTLALLVAGLCLGCYNAWRWIEREARVLRDDPLADAEVPDEH